MVTRWMLNIRGTYLTNRASLPPRAPVSEGSAAQRHTLIIAHRLDDDASAAKEWTDSDTFAVRDWARNDLTVQTL
jgi:hypothetical protein